MPDENTEVRESTATTPQVQDAETSESIREWGEEEIGAMFDGDDAKPEGEEAPKQDATEQPAKPAGEQSQQDTQPAEPTHKIKVRGEEREVPLSELKKLAEAGGDYTRQMQALAEQRRQVESLSALGEALRQDPGLRDYLAAYRQQGQQQAQQPPVDPLERIQYEAEQRALAKMHEQFGPVLQQMQHQTRIQSTLAQVQQDPLHGDVYGEIKGWLASMPEDYARETYQRLDTDPDFFTRTYSHFRDGVQKKAAQPKQDTQPAPIPQARETRAPALEQPGAEQPDQSRKARFKELSRRAANGDIAALGAMFDA